MNEQIIPMNFDDLVDEIKTIYVETRFSAEWTLLEGYHAIGKLLHEYKESTGMSYNQLCDGVANASGKRSTSLFYAIKFYERFNDINLLPEGKNVSWRGIVSKYLTTDVKKIDKKGVEFLKTKDKTVQKRDVQRVERSESDTLPETPCCFIHPDRSAVWHHFPRTKARGGTKVIPLCPECHTECHSDPYVFWCGWLWENRHLLFDVIREVSND